MERPKWSQQPLPSRAAQMKTLKANTEFDVLIIGGGATGAGAALDAASRGKQFLLFVQTLVAFVTLVILILNKCLL